MTASKIRQQELRAPIDSEAGATNARKSVRGTGRFSHLTYGTGEPKVTNVLGAALESMDWNGPQEGR